MIRALGFMDKVNTMRYVVMFRSPIAFLCGVGSVFLMLALGVLFQEPTPTTKLSVTIAHLFIVLAIYPLAGVVGCLLFPRHPLRAAYRLTLGVFVGISLHIVLFPNFGGYERNLFPFEVAMHTIWAGLLCFLIAAFWKVK
jgi:hypothetical protein